MSKISSMGLELSNSKFDVITDLQKDQYVTEVFIMVKEGVKINRKIIERINLGTTNLTTALQKHDEIVEKFCKSKT